jgi:PKHD-type hydroxylase
MIVCIPDVLTAAEVAKLREDAPKAPFVSGSATAGNRARRIKNNEEISQKAEERKPLYEIVIGALMRNRDFMRAAQPKRILAPLISRYRPGMAYGNHIDNSLMGPPAARARVDVSVTVFIADVNDYDGGELAIHSPFGFQSVKLPAGWAVVYPSSTLHEVTEVTRGERLVAVTWIQSLLRDDHQREIVAHLARIRDKLGEIAPDDPETDLAHHAYENLLRMWSDT